MAKKQNTKKLNDLSQLGGMVYSTNPDYQPETEQEDAEEESVAPNQQNLYVSRDKKSRGGKVATLVEGFEGSDAQLAELGKWLKQQCGVGGTAKNGEIVVQGDKRDKVAELLRNKGFKVKLKGG